MLTNLCLGLELGIKKIDQDHKHLTERLQQMRQHALTARPNDAAHLKLLKEFRSFLYDHFTYEQKLMRAFSFPARVRHMTVHAEVMNELDELTEHFGRTSDLVARYDRIGIALHTHMLSDGWPLVYHLRRAARSNVTATAAFLNAVE